MRLKEVSFWRCLVASFALGIISFCSPPSAQATELELDPEFEHQVGDAILDVLAGTCEQLLGHETLLTESPPELPTPTIVETDTTVTITITIDGVTITIRIDKRTGKTKITVCGIKIRNVTLPCLTYWIRADDITDDLPWPLETKFCTWERGEDGVVRMDCDFDYWGIKFKGRIKVWVNEQGELCRQVDDKAPVCVPLGDMPPEIRDLWERLNIPYLPPAPPHPLPAPVPCVPRREYLCPPDIDNPTYADDLGAGDPNGANNF